MELPVASSVQRRMDTSWEISSHCDLLQTPKMETSTHIGLTEEGERKLLAMLLPQTQMELAGEEGEQMSDEESIASSVSSVSMDTVKTKRGRGRPKGSRGKRKSPVVKTEVVEEEALVGTRKRRRRMRGGKGGRMTEEFDMEEVGASKKQKNFHESITAAGSRETKGVVATPGMKYPHESTARGK